jgi:hypothetical protein
MVNLKQIRTTMRKNQNKPLKQGGSLTNLSVEMNDLKKRLDN